MKRIMIRTAAALLAAVLALPVSAVSAEKAILMDGHTGRVLYEKNPDERSLIASTTKIMTALLVCQKCNVLCPVTVPREAVGIEGSSMYLREGEKLAVQELLYGLMLRSGNDAAVALAIYCGGSTENFVRMMNAKAARLGLAGTHFANPNGLDHPDHYSTARDLAVLTAYAMKNPIFRQTVSAKSVRIGERVLRNHNRLLWMAEGAEGVKTGYTKAAGRILVSSALRRGRRLICVTIRAPEDWQDHRTLLDRGFSQYRPVQILEEGQQVGRIPVVGGTAASVPILAGSAYLCCLGPGEEPELRIRPEQFAYAPVVRGAEAGPVYICVDGGVLGSVMTYYGETAEMEQPPARGIRKFRLRRSKWQNEFKKSCPPGALPPDGRPKS